MTLPEFRSALEGLPVVDIIDFDMCLMRGYETLGQLGPILVQSFPREALSKALLGAVRDGGSRFQRSWGR